MSETVNIEVVGYNRPELSRTVDIQFSELITQPTATQLQPTPLPTIAEFFQYYQDLFFQIPKFGETNSHEYLVNTSGDYIQGAQVNQEILALQQEITQLRQENLQLQQNLVNITTIK